MAEIRSHDGVTHRGPRVLQFDCSECQQCGPLCLGDTRQIRDVHTFVAALRLEGVEAGAAFYIPELHRPVKTATCCYLTVGRHCNAPDCAGVALKDRQGSRNVSRACS